ncbi:MAG TPA: hypothetical protein PLC89_20340 [Haliscomenobacter sp.]|uniref:hypothetical protein n=1 Tax=Haliscomenobacter sp. TaxID=2717303 RepID=UPI002CC82F47|nr:hypothetical protein [Haliscomenobacter sp.]HOY19673.1 hypothetical protein [Haliscomenobacter sp.]
MNWKKIDKSNPPKDMVLARLGSNRPYIGYIEIEDTQPWVKLSEHDYDSEMVDRYILLSELESLGLEE